MSPPSADREGHAPPRQEASDSDAEYEEIVEEEEVEEEEDDGEGGEEDMEIDELEVEVKVERGDEQKGEREERRGGGGPAQEDSTREYSLDHCKYSTFELLLALHCRLPRASRVAI
ncbi:hypothetical protein CDL15_Pgr000150 [Punica granatum]|uniref:Uncharacterized protein n=1 Tax=Punica granatum TaxID=22663 RepID=A0A218Y2V6_PUNGR|nr:hypothetical protein CDL15_Pgr000150 [Punica granatum]PKI79464.1 hypothetical protein CRG98_000095 [Punica granatum]